MRIISEVAQSLHYLTGKLHYLTGKLSFLKCGGLRSSPPWLKFIAAFMSAYLVSCYSFPPLIFRNCSMCILLILRFHINENLLESERLSCVFAFRGRILP